MHDDFNSLRWKKELEKIPNVKELKMLLKEFSELDLSSKTIEEIKLEYDSRVGIIPGISNSVPPEIVKGVRLFRARKNVNYERENRNLISTYSYPVASFVNWNGRGNIKNAPVFYGADNVETANHEIEVSEQDIVSLAVWRMNPAKNVNFTGLILENLSEDNIWKGISQKQYDQMVKSCTEIGLDKVEELILINRVFAFWFVDEEFPYSKASWYANRCLYKLDGNDVLIYPSYATGRRNCCWAIHPNFVDNCMYLEKVIEYRINEIRDSKYAMSILSVAEMGITNLIWRKPVEEDLMMLIKQ